MQSIRSLVVSTLAVFSLLAMPCHAQDGVAEIPETKPVQGLPMLSGGVGDEEIEAIRNVTDYNVKLLFTEVTGAYLSDLTVIISQNGLPIANTVTQGPVLLVKLPVGEYHVNASVSGYTQEKKFKVSAKGRTNVHVAFPMHDSVD